MKRLLIILCAIVCALTAGADQYWEAVNIYASPYAMFGSDWNDSYTLKVAVKRWNGEDSDEGIWDNYQLNPIDAAYDSKRLYQGDIWVCFAGFAQLTFYAEGTELRYDFWPPETNDGHWIEKSDFGNKIFTSWCVADGLHDYTPDPFIRETAGYTLCFDNTVSQWENVYLRIGRSSATGLGCYASSRAFTRIEGTDLWVIHTEDWQNADVWTITDCMAETGAVEVEALPAEANRLYWYPEDLAADKLIAPYGTAQGEGPYYWASEHSSAYLYTRSTTAGRYGTVCLPRQMIYATGAELFAVLGKQMDGMTPVNIWLETADAPAAGVPVVFKAQADELTFFCAGDEGAEPDNSTSNGLIGSFSEQDIDANGNNYILTANAIQMAGAGCKVGANRAYFDLSIMDIFDPAAAATPAPGKRRVGLANNEAQVVTDLSATEAMNSDAPFYDLLGRVVANPQNGIYIHNGEKVIINR